MKEEIKNPRKAAEYTINKQREPIVSFVRKILLTKIQCQKN